MPIHRLRAQKGNSFGGFTRKIHARCDNQGRPLGFALTGGQVSDYKATDALMKLSVPTPKAMLADRGYDSDSFHLDLLLRGILPVIPSRTGRNRVLYEFSQSRRREALDRFFVNVSWDPLPAFLPSYGSTSSSGCFARRGQ
ncbi:transposase [Gluconobacter kondonii]|nr:transposase [Gluconobacter kondonii]